MFRSPSLEKVWDKGHALIGDVTFESAAYVARYIMKKVTNDETRVDHNGKVWLSKDEHYKGRHPEYTTMSRRPGIGMGWIKKYLSDVYPSDGVVIRGVEVRPPRAYDRVFEISDSSGFARMKEKRRLYGIKVSPDNDSYRLATKEEVKKSRIKLLMRTMEMKNDD